MSQTTFRVHCPLCGAALEAPLIVRNIHVVDGWSEDKGSVVRLDVTWHEASTREHACPNPNEDKTGAAS